jgi:transposase-like protein
MNSRPNDMTEAQLAEWQYAHRPELESDEGEEVEVDISPQLSVTISFRLPGAEADAIREAAREAGLSLSQWIRQACADALDPDNTGDSRRAAQAELRDATRQLETLARRLGAAARKQTPSGGRTREKMAVRKNTGRAAAKKASGRA